MMFTYPDDPTFDGYPSAVISSLTSEHIGPATTILEQSQLAIGSYLDS